MWQKVLLRFLVVIVVILTLTIAGSLILLKWRMQYYCGERLDTDALRILAEQHVAAARAMAERPKEDRDAMQALLDDLSSNPDIGQYEDWILESCPAQVPETIEAHRDQILSLIHI